MLIAFVAATLFWLAVALVLSHRQVVHVRANRAHVPADFADTVTLADHQRAADYTVARERFARLDTLLDTAVTLAWVLGGIAALYGAVAAVVPPGLIRGVVFLVATTVVRSLIGLPLDLVRVFGLEARFGFNKTTLGTFLADRLKGALIGLVVAVPLLAAALWVMGTFRGLWWLWTWVALVILMAVAPAIYVRLIAPRFNRFLPLEEGPLRARIEGLLGQAGFRSSGLFTMDASRRSTHGNAFFIGFGRAKRIVLFDTLLDRSSTEEVAAVVAHELGHFRHKHVLFGLAQGAATLLVGLAAFGWLCQQPTLLPAFGIGAQDHALDLFVCLLLASVVGPLLTPLTNWISRRNEFQADDYARRAVGAAPMISALTGLARDNAATLTPDPVYALAHYSHPPVPVRVRQLRRTAAA